MTSIKLDSKVATNANDALLPHVGNLYANLGKRIVGVVELAATERSQPAPDEDKEAAVKLQIKHLEIASPEQEEPIRETLRALYTHRTAYGKLDEDGEVELSERTIADCAGRVNAIEAARLHTAVEHWGDYARQASRNGKLTAAEVRRELTTVADALHALIHPDAIRKGDATS